MSKDRISQKTRRIALSAVLSALCALILLLASAFETIDLTLAALASLPVALAAIEMEKPWDILIYAVSSLLALLLAPSRLPAVCFALFLGFYPMLKKVFERLIPPFAWALKFSLFNTSLLAIFAVCRFLLRLPENDAGIWLYIVANVAFLAYDLFLSAVLTLYLVKFRSRLRINAFFGKGTGEEKQKVDNPREKGL